MGVCVPTSAKLPQKDPKILFLNRVDKFQISRTSTLEKRLLRRKITHHEALRDCRSRCWRLLMERLWLWRPTPEHHPRPSLDATSKISASSSPSWRRHWWRSPRGSWRNSLFTTMRSPTRAHQITPKCSTCVFTHKFLISYSRQLFWLEGHLSWFYYIRGDAT